MDKIWAKFNFWPWPPVARYLQTFAINSFTFCLNEFPPNLGELTQWLIQAKTRDVNQWQLISFRRAWSDYIFNYLRPETNPVQNDERKTQSKRTGKSFQNNWLEWISYKAPMVLGFPSFQNRQCQKLWVNETTTFQTNCTTKQYTRKTWKKRKTL